MRFVIIMILILAALEGIGYWAYKTSQRSDDETGSVAVDTKRTVFQEKEDNQKDNPLQDFETIDLDDPENRKKYGELLSREITTYPIIQMEEVDGVTERNIHMGIREWTWDPMELEAKKGERVRLIVHSSLGVSFSFLIPGLGIESEITEDGGIVEFMAEETGEFEYVCGGYCEEKGNELLGKIKIN